MALGVIVYTTVPAVFPVVVSNPAGMIEVVPLVINPVTPLADAVHVNVVPAILEVRTTAWVVAPLQTVCGAG